MQVKERLAQDGCAGGWPDSFRLNSSSSVPPVSPLLSKRHKTDKVRAGARVRPLSGRPAHALLSKPHSVDSKLAAASAAGACREQGALRRC